MQLFQNPMFIFGSLWRVYPFSTLLLRKLPAVVLADQFLADEVIRNNNENTSRISFLAGQFLADQCAKRMSISVQFQWDFKGIFARLAPVWHQLGAVWFRLTSSARNFIPEVFS